MKMRMLFRGIGALVLLVAMVSTAQNKQPAQKTVPSHADAAVILAKYSGLFERYIGREADLNECISFLNKHGIYFGLMEVVSGKEFTVKDCARVMGQVQLVFSGEAEFSGGKVKLPKGVDSWEDFCIMNDVQYVHGYQQIVGVLSALQEIE